MKRAVLLLAGVALVAGAGLEAAAPGPQTGMLATPP